MPDEVRPEVRARARAQWETGKPLETGRAIHEALAASERPRWAGELLAVLYLRARGRGRVSRMPNVEHVLAVTSEARRWMEARDAHAALHTVLLEEHRQKPLDLLRLGLLGFAEVVAKVTYNASGAEDPFERNIGWRVAASLRPILDELCDPALEAACVSRLLCE